jgi:hypothetical protein
MKVNRIPGLVDVIEVNEIREITSGRPGSLPWRGSRYGSFTGADLSAPPGNNTCPDEAELSAYRYGQQRNARQERAVP